MANKTIIRLNEHSPNHAEWITVNELGRQVTEPEASTLNNFPDEYKTNVIIVLLPALDVTTTFLNLPIKSTNKIKKAIPFALEEDLACDINLLHFSFKKIKNNAYIPVSIIEKKKFHFYQQLLMECNIYPQDITSEIFGLPMIQRTVSVIVEPKKTLINNGLNKAYVLENENIRDLNDLINEVKEDANHVQVYLDNSIQDQYKDLQEEQENINIKLLAGSSLQKISQIIVNSNYVNLLQGEYAPKVKLSKFLKPWRYTAYLILALITILMANRTLSYIQLTKYEKNLSARFLYEYQNIQPNANNISDPIRIISGLKNANPVKTDTSFFLTSLHELSKAMSSGKDILVTSITYQEDVTIIRLIGPNVTLIDTIRREINKNGIFQATILSTNQIANDVESRIEIKAVAL